MIEKDLIAPCGMNCSLCIAYQFKDNNLNQHGFSRKYCPGCIPRGENCTHMGHICALLKTGEVRFCFKCLQFPCTRLRSLDKRYRTKYHMSMIENLLFIQQKGIEEFLKKEALQWKCPKCEHLVCCHNGLCMSCDLEVLISRRKYRWDKG